MESRYLSVLDYLPQLDKPVLDDRSFEDLLEECLLRIPRYCPEWTHHNASDPGITLIELFSWLVHQMLNRFNQVPYRHYIAFLELLGIQLQPPRPAYASLTFYLTKSDPVEFARAPGLESEWEPKVISKGCEVATVRTETQESIIFTTEKDLVIAHATIKHLLFSVTPVDLSNLSEKPEQNNLESVFGDSTPTTQISPNQNFLDAVIPDFVESNAPPVNLFRPCTPGSCFYLVLDELEPTGVNDRAFGNQRPNHSRNRESRLQGSVLAFTFAGHPVETTGVDPEHPPLRWQAWDGNAWRNILHKDTDDKTRGFSFDWARLRGENAPLPEADVILHLPEKWPKRDFGSGYEGHWLRCVCLPSGADGQADSFYQRPPEIRSVKVRTLGGSVAARECVQIREELLGMSNGKPGQSFQLSHQSILARDSAEYPEEYIEVRRPDGVVEPWEEREHFGDSLEDDCHYTLDSQRGIVQFGPLIREPHHLRQRMQKRRQAEAWKQPVWVKRTAIAPENRLDSLAIPAVLEAVDRESERQYGRVPPAGSEIIMKSYRTGGGSLGNVQAEQLSVLKTAIPYVKQVTNYAPALGGKNADSLEEAMLRVPVILRTRKTALTPEEFENAAQQFALERFTQEQDPYPVHRAHCITTPRLTRPGEVRLLIVPKVPQSARSMQTFEAGTHPEQLSISSFQKDLNDYLDKRRSLGIQVTTETPDYVGVSVHVQLYLKPQYLPNQHQGPSISDIEAIEADITDCLYRFLNPIVGGLDGKGWPRGQAVEDSAIIALLQQRPAVRSVARVQLYAIKKRFPHRDDSSWMQMPEPLRQLQLSDLQIATSWHSTAERDLDFAHQIEFLDFSE
ncbi:MAG: putative baseplate assembly protein [Cyanobacteria bacterium J06634_6]